MDLLRDWRFQQKDANQEIGVAGLAHTFTQAVIYPRDIWVSRTKLLEEAGKGGKLSGRE